MSGCGQTVRRRDGRETDKPVAPVVRNLGLNQGILGDWVMADRRRRCDQASDKVSESQRAELVRLGRENAQLRME